MSRRLIDTLARAGVAALSASAGAAAVGLLERIDSRELNATALARIVVDRDGGSAALTDPALRGIVIESLRGPDAEGLCRLLDLPGTDPWRELGALRWDAAAVEVLHGFFGVPLERRDAAERPLSVVEVASPYPLFPHQRAASLRVRHELAQGDRRVMLHMPTGAGKTRTAWTTVVDLLRGLPDDRVVVWLAHTEELCDQAFEEACRAWGTLGSRDLVIRRHYGPHRVPDFRQVRDGIVVAGLQLLYGDSLTRQGEVLDLSRRLALIVLDEAHQATAPTYSHLIELLNRSPDTGILGLSATPGRSLIDVDEDLALAEFFRRRKVKLEVPGHASAVDYLTAEGYLAEVEYVRLPFDAHEVRLTEAEAARVREGFDLPARVLRDIGADDLRNLLIVDQVAREVARGGNVILFAVSVEHADLLASVLNLRGVPAAAVTGSTPRERRRQTIARYRDTDAVRVLCNYGVLTTGFDAPKTNVAFIARPTTSVSLYSQMVGRAARGPRAGGNARCRVVTVVDDIPGFRSLAEGFEFWDDIWEEE